MAGMEGIRPQQKEAAFQAGSPGGLSGGGEQPEIHYGGTPKSKVRLDVDGQPRDVSHLHMDQRGGQLVWWEERESVENWRGRVQAARERRDPRYSDAAEDRIPSTVIHSYQDGFSTDNISFDYVHEEPQNRLHDVFSADDLQTRIEEQQGAEQEERGSVGYYLSAMYERAQQQIERDRESNRAVDRHELGGQVRRVAEEAEWFGAGEAEQQLTDLYWAYQARLPFERDNEILGIAAVQNYNNQQHQWMEEEGGARASVELTDPQVIRAFSWLLDQAGIQHESFDQERVSVPFEPMEAQMRLFSTAYSMGHKVEGLDHEERAGVWELMEEWQRRSEGNSDSNDREA